MPPTVAIVAAIVVANNGPERGVVGGFALGMTAPYKNPATTPQLIPRERADFDADFGLYKYN